jgi:hydrogenase expression/formation protein HypC
LIKEGEFMCLAVPMRLIKREGDIGVVELGGVKREINLMLLSDAKVDEYLIVHAGFAIQRLDEQEAYKTLEILSQMNDIDKKTLSVEFPQNKSQFPKKESNK